VNYRHHFHAGNFADVAKHALLVLLIRALQKKDKGFLYLDTHAGRGGYDLTSAARGDSLARKPEWPDGIGRLLAAADVPAELRDYLGIVGEFDRRSSGAGAASPTAAPADPSGPADALRFYPGSPWIARLLARPQDRLALCERHPEEFEALDIAFARAPRTALHAMDGYLAPRAMLPPPEKRALVLIDPPFEAADEFAHLAAATRETLERLPSAVLAIWYPLTERARVDAFFAELRGIDLPPTLIAELAIAGDTADLKMKGCGLLIVNPPWQLEQSAGPAMTFLGKILAQRPGAGGKLTWLVPEK
jgi:23S rRNA (adenine2030-N6)-methyltransferase